MLSCAQFNKLLYPTAGTSSLMNSIAVSGSIDSVASTMRGSLGAPSSETQSEVSSADSECSDVRTIALRLGIQNLDELHTDRFKVDRQKLEQLIKADSATEGMNGAEYFFDQVMNGTGTYIGWPCRLKVGAKSKKDPHVRIMGKLEDVQRAKERILAALDSRGTRIIMKMDVSYTDHSYIIGRGGNNIKRIMEDTSTHIHFPDSNRSNPTEKSNQVSLCGSLEGVEKARSLVRLSTPLLISFELPVMAPGRPQPDHETPYVNMVEAKYNVQVIFSSRPKLHSTLILVKGAEKEAAKVQEATQLLINFSCENVASQILVNMQLEITPQHHEIVKGKNNINLLSIMERTKTKIIFPDLTDMNVKPLKKSQVTITGTIDGVYKARQQLLGNLPVALIFDFPDNQNDASEVMGLSTKYGVFISLRQKQRQSTLAIVIKGVEKFVDKMYEARQEILRLATPLVKPTIPDTYFANALEKDMTAAYRIALTSLLAGNPDSPKTPSLVSTTTTVGGSDNITRGSPYASKNNNNSLSFLSTNNLLTTAQQQQQLANYTCTPTGVCAPTQKYLQMHNNLYSRQQQQQQQQQQKQQQSAVQLNLSNNYLTGSSIANAAQQQQQQQQQAQAQTQQQVSPRNSFGHNTSGYQSFSSSSTSLEQAFPPFAGNNGLGGASNAAGLVSVNNNNGGGGGGGVSSSSRVGPHYSPDSTYSSEAGCSRTGRRSSDGVLLGLGSSGPMMPGSADSYRNLPLDLKHSHIFDFDLKRAMGFKAMERPPISGEIRTPNTNWMGMGLSRTSPAPLETVDDFNWHRSAAGMPAAISPYTLGISTGIVESTPTNRRLQLTQHKDIHTLLTSLGLEHYIKMFVLNEIDLEVFKTLTEDNLIELGITAFGARKKMTVAIHALRANEAATSTMPGAVTTSPRFSGSAAPGAERRPSNQW